MKEMAIPGDPYETYNVIKKVGEGYDWLYGVCFSVVIISISISEIQQ
jgi:hypothetical protein